MKINIQDRKEFILTIGCVILALAMLLYISGLMNKNEAYRWLALITYSPQTYAHIGNMGEYYCKVVIDESKKLYKKLLEKRDTA